MVTEEPYLRAWNRTKRTKLDVGFERMRAVAECLDSLDRDGSFRSSMQSEMHLNCQSASARLIMGSGFDEAKVMERYGYAPIDMLQWICLITPRRTGKSRGMSQYAYSVLTNVPKVGSCAPHAPRPSLTHDAGAHRRIRQDQEAGRGHRFAGAGNHYGKMPRRAHEEQRQEHSVALRGQRRAQHHGLLVQRGCTFILSLTLRHPSGGRQITGEARGRAA